MGTAERAPRVTALGRDTFKVPPDGASECRRIRSSPALEGLIGDELQSVAGSVTADTSELARRSVASGDPGFTSTETPSSLAEGPRHAQDGHEALV